MPVPKRIYGLAEAPRLWYLRARKVFEQCGYTELKMRKSTFVLIGPEELTHSICNLHVDDGLLVGNNNSKVFMQAFQNMKRLFVIKEWLDLRRKPHSYLGVDTWQNADNSRTESMEDHIKGIKPIPVKRGEPE